MPDFSLPNEYLSEFLHILWFSGSQPHPMNAGLSNQYGDGALDLAVLAFGKADAAEALLHLNNAAEMAGAPTGFDADLYSLPSPASLERHRMHLAARVALALTQNAMPSPACQPATKPEPELIFTLEETHGEGEALEPLELPADFMLKLADANPQVQFELLPPAPLCRHCGGFGWVPSVYGENGKETCGFCKGEPL